MYKYSYDIIDKLIFENIIKASEAKGKPISCKKGCYYCCYEQVLAQGIEALITTAWINNQTTHFRRKIIKNLKKWQQKMESSKLNLDIKMPQEVYLEADKYWKSNIPCPFLFHNSCLIYQVRPFACRTMLAASPPENCKRLDGAVIVNCSSFEQYVRSEFLKVSQMLLNLPIDYKQKEILTYVSWFPYLVIKSLE